MSATLVALSREEFTRAGRTKLDRRELRLSDYLQEIRPALDLIEDDQSAQASQGQRGLGKESQIPGVLQI
jgi:hypothetical protein